MQCLKESADFYYDQGFSVFLSESKIWAVLQNSSVLDKASEYYE